MARTCIKCGYTRRDSDYVASYACPACGIVYAKAEAAHAEQLAARERAQAWARQQAAVAARVVQPPPPAAGVTASPDADALVQQVLLAQAGGKRGTTPYRGMALAVLIAFSAGFASAAVIYSGVAKLAKQPAGARPAQACVGRGG